MKTIYYSLCGEGLGHSTRALSVLENLESTHNIILFSYGQAYSYLKALNKNVIEIKGLKFSYNSDGSINSPKTLWGTLKYLFDRPQSYYGKPDLCISDWEPSLYRYARQIDVPILSITSQHKFKFSKSISPYQYLMKGMCSYFRADHYIVSTFQYENVIESDLVSPVYGFISNKLVKKNTDNFILAYSKDQSFYNLVKSKFPCLPIIHFGPHSNRADFPSHLVRASRVVSTAGCQLISECASLGIPIHVYPIKNQYEQIINGYDVEKLNIGKYERTDSKPYRTLEDLPNNFTQKYVGMNGLPKSLEIIRKYL